VRLSKDDKGKWQIAQLPKVEAALVSLDPKDGAILALAGGFEFTANKFNHVTQALRQPGSSFKPFIYSAALEKGFTAASVINDSPIVIGADVTGSGEVWEPKNYDGRYDGPMRMRTALVKSKNMVSIRLLQNMGPKFAQDYITRFGFVEKDHPAYLTMALGAGSTTPLQLASGYAVFANGGYRVKPYFIRKITDNKGTVLEEATPEMAGVTAERVIDSRNAFIMSSIMRDVVTSGTATRALKLNRKDIGGKTGTTNDHFDAWFAGFSPNLVGVAWIGFDQPSDLGNDETGGKAALPMWIDYMATALKPYSQKEPKPPEGLVQMNIDGKTEWIYSEMQGRIQNIIESEQQKANEEVKSQIF
jgi:penicillin-binding protein 1A